MSILLKYNDKSKIDKVADILFSKGINVFNSLDKTLLTDINEGEFRLKGIEIYNEDPNSRLNFYGLFDSEIEILSNIEHIKRAIYILLDSKSKVPPHMDDDDQSYRVLTGIISSENTEFTIANTTVKLDFKKSFGFNASSIEHSSINRGVSCTMLVICLANNPFDNSNLVEIIEGQ